MVFVQGQNDSKVLLLSQGTGSEVEPLVPASIFQEPTSVPCRTGILAGKSCPQDGVDSESQGVSSEQKSRRRGDVLRGTMEEEEEEESSWLLFKFRETKAEMTGREGGKERKAGRCAAPPGLRGSGLSQGRTHSSESFIPHAQPSGRGEVGQKRTAGATLGRDGGWGGGRGQTKSTSGRIAVTLRRVHFSGALLSLDIFYSWRKCC